MGTIFFSFLARSLHTVMRRRGHHRFLFLEPSQGRHRHRRMFVLAGRLDGHWGNQDFRRRRRGRGRLRVTTFGRLLADFLSCVKRVWGRGKNLLIPDKTLLRWWPKIAFDLQVKPKTNLANHALSLLRMVALSEWLFFVLVL